MKKVGIGDVIVHRGMPEDNNPYHRASLMSSSTMVYGDERVRALTMLADNDRRLQYEPYTFWYAPVDGGSHLIVSREEVNWTGLREALPCARRISFYGISGEVSYSVCNRMPAEHYDLDALREMGETIPVHAPGHSYVRPTT